MTRDIAVYLICISEQKKWKLLPEINFSVLTHGIVEFLALTSKKFWWFYDFKFEFSHICRLYLENSLRELWNL